jgi:hypothetical protein
MTMKILLGWILIAVLVAGGIAFYMQQKKLVDDTDVTAEQEKPLALPKSPPKPAIENPVPEPDQLQTPEESTKEVMPQEPLPALSDSDKPLLDDLNEYFNLKQYQHLFVLKAIIQRFVVTVNNLSSSSLPEKYLLTRPVAGKFLVKNSSDPEGEDNTAILDPANYERYSVYVKLLEAVDINQLVALYVHYYPLFQQAYESLGYPGKYFNDRLVEVIDNLLDAPVIREEIKLIQPKVFYQYADPKLEALSAGQKIMLRMGPDNAERVKVVLRQLRLELIR